MNYYNEIKDKLIQTEIYDRVKDYSKERNRVNTYYEIGKLLSEAGKKYGERIIDEYSKKLTIEIGKKYNKRTLYRMKQFYILFKDKKVSPLATQLSWSHFQELLPLKDIDKINYYIQKAISNKLSKNDLRKIIKEQEYDRLSDDTKLKLISQEQLQVEDLIPNPIIIKNNTNNIISEFVLKQLILENLDEFLNQLGNNFSYIGNEYKIKIGNRYNYIDLLLYNIEYNCYVVIELKITELKKEHIGQLEVYMNYIDSNLKRINQNKTIGIIICKKDNKYIIEYCSDKRILSREYVLI